MAEFYNYIESELIEHFKSNKDQGLDENQVKSRQSTYGYNELKEKDKLSRLAIFISQFKSFIIYILIFALIISIFISEYIDSIVIFIILILNAILGFIQEYRAEKAIAALKKLSALKARVIRSGHIILIETKEIVPGDILLIEEGTKISADGRIIESSMLETLESSLTGESNPIVKISNELKGDIALAERKNMVYSGTIVSKGRARIIVTATGMNTEIGKIAGLISEVKKESTPLQKKLEKLGKAFGFGTIIIAIVILIIGIVKENLFDFIIRGDILGFLTGSEKWLVTAVALAVAAVPEGLPAIVTITLAIGTKKMLKKNALIRKLPSVETLGDVTVICSDKTGTLTENKMTVRKAYVSGKEIDISGNGYSLEGELKCEKKINKDDLMLFKIGILCNNSGFIDNSSRDKTILPEFSNKTISNENHITHEIVYEKKEDKIEVIGDPTEAALLISATKAGLNYDELTNYWKRTKEIPFDSIKKLMSTINVEEKTHKNYLFSKGAPERILERCNKIYVNGKVRNITKKDIEELIHKNEEFSKQSLRVLGFAYKEVKTYKNLDNIDENLIFVGLQGMIDPPRTEVKISIEKCKEAGIRIIMITGDNVHTAESIAKEIGINGTSINGSDFANLSEDRQILVLENTNIFARVEPAHKMTIVNLLQKRGEIVAMTGDGVNDAPAIKKADIGIAMGLTGTDVTKETSDMILEDDNFSTIVNAIEEGRGIKENIRKFVNYLLSSNLAEVMIIFFALLFSWPLPMTAVMLLWMNLVTDGLPALALGVDGNPPNLMKKPAKRRSGIIDRTTGIKIAFMSILMTLGVLALFYLSMNNYSELEGVLFHEKIQTIAFTTIVLMEIVRIQSIRNEYKLGMFSNKYLIMAVLSSIILQLLVIYTPLNIFFGTTILNLIDWVYIMGAVIAVFIMNGIGLLVIKKFDRG